jgi:hypothetical protein
MGSHAPVWRAFETPEESVMMKSKMGAVLATVAIVVLAACTAEQQGAVVEPEPGELAPADLCPVVGWGHCPSGAPGDQCAFPNTEPPGCPVDSHTCACKPGLICYQSFCCQMADPVAACAGKACGTVLDNGCGGTITCSQTNSYCSCGTCQAGQCGTMDDGCGHTLNCGGCGYGNHCGAGFCHKNCPAGYSDCNGGNKCVKITSCQ